MSYSTIKLLFPSCLSLSFPLSNCHSLQPHIYSPIISSLLLVSSPKYTTFSLHVSHSASLSPICYPFYLPFGFPCTIIFSLSLPSHAFLPSSFSFCCSVLPPYLCLSLSLLPQSSFPRGYYLSRRQICPIINLISSLSLTLSLIHTLTHTYTGCYCIQPPRHTHLFSVSHIHRGVSTNTFTLAQKTPPYFGLLHCRFHCLSTHTHTH